jgi:hypothetical protein
MKRRIKFIRIVQSDHEYCEYHDNFNQIVSYGLNNWQEIDQETFAKLSTYSGWIRKQHGLVMIEDPEWGSDEIKATVQEIADMLLAQKKQEEKDIQRRAATKKKAEEKRKQTKLEKARKLLEEAGEI